MRRVLVTSTNTSMHEFLLPHIKCLIENGYVVEIACSHVAGRFEQLNEAVGEEVKVHRVNLYRSPVRIGNLKGLRELRQIIRDGHFDLIWTNEPVMGVMTRLAAIPARRTGTKVLYMAHGFHFFHGAPLKNWLLYYPVEKIMSVWTDILVTINQEDYALAKKKMHAKQVEYIPGIGVDTNRFFPDAVTEGKKDAIRRSLGLERGDKMLLSVGELIPRKNHEVVIRALAELRAPSIKYYICGEGELRPELEALIEKLGLEGSVFLLGYREDIPQLCACADLFIMPSLQEGLPVALMEALASKTPVICANIRGNTDLIAGKNALFECRDVSGAAAKITEYLTEPHDDEVERNYENIKRFDLESVKESVKKLAGGVFTESIERRN